MMLPCLIIIHSAAAPGCSNKLKIQLNIVSTCIVHTPQKGASTRLVDHDGDGGLVPGADLARRLQAETCGTVETLFDFESSDQGWTVGIDETSTCGATVSASKHWSLGSSLPGGGVSGTWWTNPNDGSDGGQSVPTSHLHSSSQQAPTRALRLTPTLRTNQATLFTMMLSMFNFQSMTALLRMFMETPQNFTISATRRFVPLPSPQTPASPLVTASSIDSCSTRAMAAVVAAASLGGTSLMLRFAEQARRPARRPVRAQYEPSTSPVRAHLPRPLSSRSPTICVEPLLSTLEPQSLSMVL
jgi:hypothetical protein